MSKTILIGNGPIKGLGTAIDKGDTVIRMHHNDISCHSKDVGTKMDIWIAPMGLVREWMDIPENIKECKEIWTFSQERGNCGPNHILREKYGEKVLGCGRDFTRDIYLMYKEGRHPTKGFQALQFALLRLPHPIHIAGFSFYQTKQAWFWDNSYRDMPSVYDIKFEKQAIFELIREGKVEWLKRQ